MAMKLPTEKNVAGDSEQELKVLRMDLVLTAVGLDKTELAALVDADRPSVSKALGSGEKYRRLRLRIADMISARVRDLFSGN